jgi:TPR repeat protein
MPSQPQQLKPYQRPIKEEYYAPLQMRLRDAEGGDAKAQKSLGDFYIYDNNLGQNYEMAAQWFRKAADQGNADAQCSLGSLYHYGKGVPQDDLLAAQWKRKAADQGYAQAQRTLGFLYSEGKGVTQDYEKAAQWFRRAADQGDDYAKKILATIINSQGGQQNFVQIRNAADQGNVHAQRSLGEFYSYGKGVPQAFEQAAKWFRKAAEQDDAHSQKVLGEFFRDGKGVPQDNEQAFKWFRKAADQGDASAQKAASLLYSDDKIDSQNSVGEKPLLQNEALLREYLSDRNHLFDRYSLGQLCDALATILYERGEYSEAADLYLRAYDDNYYKHNDEAKGLYNLNVMRQTGILPSGSASASRLQQQYQSNAANVEKARSTAAWGAFATFVAYHILVYANHTTGILNDGSLFFAGGLSWVVWNMVLSNFERK